MTWASNAGVEIPDLVPASLRRDWVASGRCPDRDLYGLFRDHVRDHPDRDAVIDAQGVLTYTELDVLARHRAVQLITQGLGPGDIIGISLPNGRSAVAAELAVAAIGAVSLAFPSRGTRDTLSLLGRARAAGAIVDRPLLALGLPHLRAVIATDAPPCPAPLPDIRVDPDSPARILISSGSEAEPKMVAYSHNAIAGGRASYVRALHSGDAPMRNLVLVPLASSFGSCGVPVTIAALGATLLVQDSFDPAAALRVIDQHRPTHLIGVPTMLRRIADLPGSDLTTTSLVAVVSSGAALPDATASACRSRFRVPVITVYGSTDGVNCHTTATSQDSTHSGLPDPSVTEIAITDPGGRRLPVGTPGEICALGPMTPMSYVAAPDLNARYRLPGGWVRTGDRGLLDESGHLHVLGRIRHVVIRGGYTISPAEVERLLATHPDVAEVACVGVPDSDLGERLCACVVQRPGTPSLTLPVVTDFLHAQHGLEKCKLPERLMVIPQLPLGATGKVCLHSLTAMATAGRNGFLTPPRSVLIEPIADSLS